MKKNKMMRIASVLLVAVLLSTCAISGTFAKYITTASADDTARVALWNIEVNDTRLTTTGSAQTVTFNLFNYEDDNVDVDGLDNNDKVVAPGTSGSFAFTIENLSEVNAQYTITLTESTNNNIPLQYSLDGNQWVDSISELTLDALTDVAIGSGVTGTTHTVHWRWVFEGTTQGAHAGQTDVTDTTLGLAGAAEVTISVGITVSQVN